ncbi:MAG: class IV adenylate cyclase [Pyrinomonadaceae bacterium]
MAIEIEKKYRLTEEIRREIVASLEEFGAEFIGEDTEVNSIFANKELVERNAVVRIRETQNRSILTFKRRLPSTSGAKEQVEFESEIADAVAIRSIIEAIGLKRAIVYEKRRRTYHFRKVEVVLDELPFGLFMEIEGPISAIAEAEMLLGVEDLEVVQETYPRMAVRFGIQNGDAIECRFALQK